MEGPGSGAEGSASAGRAGTGSLAASLSLASLEFARCARSSSVHPPSSFFFFFRSAELMLVNKNLSLTAPPPPPPPHTGGSARARSGPRTRARAHTPSGYSRSPGAPKAGPGLGKRQEPEFGIAGTCGAERGRGEPGPGGTAPRASTRAVPRAHTEPRARPRFRPHPHCADRPCPHPPLPQDSKKQCPGRRWDSVARGRGGAAAGRAGCGRGGRGVRPRSFIENNNSAAGERAGQLRAKASLFLAAVAK